ncbi:MAG: DUF1802 family protein [Planctomycetaceae bacterium]|nr:DUF1802 family protein [Planctomycetaceae bacterium]
MNTPEGFCAVAFKEWAGVCQALGEGRQSLIVRKGGIDEGPAGFAPEHQLFWLYPTYVHQAQQGLRVDPATSETGRGTESSTSSQEVAISLLARVELIQHVTSEDRLAALAPFHVWTDETLRKRFAYRRPGLWVLGVRIFHRGAPWILRPTPEQLGCKSWVTLDPALSTAGLLPVLDDHAAAHQARRLREVLGLREDRREP